MEEIISIIKKCTPNLSWSKADRTNTTEDPSANKSFWDVQAENKLCPQIYSAPDLKVHSIYLSYNPTYFVNTHSFKTCL